MYAWFEKLFNPFPADDVKVPPKTFRTFVWEATRGARIYILLMGLLAAVIGVFEAFLFAALGKIVDWLATVEPAQLWAQEGTKLLLLTAIICGSILLVAVQTFIKRQTFAGNFPMRMRWNFHRLMLRQSMSFYQDEFAGRITAKVMQTAQALRDICIIILDIMIYAVIYFVTMIVTIGHFEIWLLGPFALWLAAYLLALRWFVPRLAKASKWHADAKSILTGRITDAYTNIATVKLFAHAGREALYARKAMRDFLAAIHSLNRNVSGIEIVNQTLGMLLIVGAMIMVLWLWTKGLVGVGALAAIGAMTLRLNGLAHWIMWESTALFEQIGTIHDGMETLARPQTVVDAPNAKILQVSRGEICFDNVSFNYSKTKDKNVIENFCLTIKPGEKIGLVGRSGAGKSTLVSLLLRFHDVTGGKILIDGQDIAHVTQESLRRQIGMVMQDTSLLHRSVRDNILYGKPDAAEEEVNSALQRAAADLFVPQLEDPKGRKNLDAHVGERGVKLSGGQRQRIAIARVMLKDAPILLLDEATSALDSEVELAIQENLYRLMQGKTVVAIAHRLSTIAAMDRLVVVDEGRIVEQGDHYALLNRDGVYAKLWKHQSGGFLGVDREAA